MPPLAPLLLLLLAAAIDRPGAVALDDGVAIQPPRGWSSWYAFFRAPSQEKMELAAEVLATHRGPSGSGPTLAQLGYDYVQLDDGYQHCGAGVNKSFHDAAGKLLVDPKKFSSLASMNARIHALNLSSGWYLNNWICSENGQLHAGFSLQQDADAVAALGFDGVKLDSGGPNGDIFAWHKALVVAAENASRLTPLYINNCHNSVQHTDPSHDSLATQRPNTDQVPYLHEDEVNITGAQLLVCPMHSWRVSHDMNPNFPQVRNRLFCDLRYHFILKLIILPRQPQDKHRESDSKRDAFSNISLLR
jgi:hypothetical protein